MKRFVVTLVARYLVPSLSRVSIATNAGRAILLSIGLLASSASHAQFPALNLTPGVPDIASPAQIDISYIFNAGTGVGTLIAFGGASQLNLPPGQPIAGGLFQLTASIDTNNMTATGTLVINGTSAPFVDPLLTATLSAFGAGAGDPLEFNFNVTGGSTAGIFGSSAGVIISNSGYTGNLMQNFGTGGSFAASADTFSSILVVPDILIEKFTNGHDGDDANGTATPTPPDGAFAPGANEVAQVVVGSPVVWTYRVTNTGTEDLVNILVTDAEASAQGAVIICPGTGNNTIPFLAVGSSVDCTASLPGGARNLAIGDPDVVPGCGDGRPTYENIGAANGAGQISGAPVSDQDPSHYCNPTTPGTIIINKVTDPAGAPVFGFTSDIPSLNNFGLADGDTLTVNSVLPGPYTVTEDNPGPFFALSTIDCDDPSGGTVTNVPGRAADIDLAPGETVECTFTNALPVDFGDAPDTYGTLLGSNGARHFLSDGLFLGALVDGEGDASPPLDGTGDDVTGVSDEDGVVFTSPLLADAQATVDVTASIAGGRLNAWVDFDGNGIFGAGEQVFTDVALASGLNSLAFNVPAGATPGTTFARFRLDSVGGLAPTGLAANGEVEDAEVLIVAPDLTATKTNDVAGTALLGLPFNWTVTVANTDTGDAIFADTEVILSDQLPAGATYGAASVLAPVNITGPGAIVCSIVPTDLLTCSASGGSVTMGATTGSFDVQVETTPTLLGVLNNPDGGVCTVDPNGNVTESDENNNDCQNTVNVVSPDLTLTKDDGSSDAALGQYLSYTLSYANVGDAPADNVVITDTVPVAGEFQSDISTAGWNCVPNKSAGSLCTITVGTLNPGQSAEVVFVARLISPALSEGDEFVNVASIADDGTNGIEPTPSNNTDDDRNLVVAVIQAPLLGPLGLALMVVLLGLVGARFKGRNA